MSLKLTPLKRKPLEGSLNHYRFFQDKNGRVFLCRKPIENRILWEEIRKEYEGIGFFRLGGEIRRRSTVEQGKLCCEWAALRLPVLMPVKFSATEGWYPFIKGITYDQWLNSGELSICTLTALLRPIRMVLCMAIDGGQIQWLWAIQPLSILTLIFP